MYRFLSEVWKCTQLQSQAVLALHQPSLTFIMAAASLSCRTEGNSTCPVATASPHGKPVTFYPRRQVPLAVILRTFPRKIWKGCVNYCICYSGGDQGALQMQTSLQAYNQHSQLFSFSCLSAQPSLVSSTCDPTLTFLSGNDSKARYLGKINVLWQLHSSSS